MLQGELKSALDIPYYKDSCLVTGLIIPCLNIPAETKNILFLQKLKDQVLNN